MLHVLFPWFRGEWEAITTVWIRTRNAAEVEEFANMNDIRL
jgi:hypothetical protein